MTIFLGKTKGICEIMIFMCSLFHHFITHTRKITRHQTSHSAQKVMYERGFLTTTYPKYSPLLLWHKPTCLNIKKSKGSPYSITERRVPELIPVLGSPSLQVMATKPPPTAYYRIIFGTNYTTTTVPFYLRTLQNGNIPCCARQKK